MQPAVLVEQFQQLLCDFIVALLKTKIYSENFVSIVSSIRKSTFSVFWIGWMIEHPTKSNVNIQKS
jgi:hypothetical protein